MECNKDEAIRAKKLAEKKLIEKDLAGARRFASKAQNLFPGLEGLSQFQEILDVHVASERKMNGEADWYGIIGVDPLADDDTIRKKYRKLAFSLHPDKNKCVGADGAFKLLSESWSILSDKAKKAAYDQNHNIKVSYDKFGGSNPQADAMKNVSKRARMSNSSYPTHHGSGERESGHYSSNPHTFQTSKKVKTSKSSSPATHDSGEMQSGLCRSNPKTFWTSCRRCSMQYEYLIMYLNKKLICPNCRLPFLAFEMPPPPSSAIAKPSSHGSFNQKQQGGNQHLHGTSYLERKRRTRKMGNSRLPSNGSTKEVQKDSCAGEVNEVSLRKKTDFKKNYSGLASENAVNPRNGETLAKKRRLNEPTALGSKMPGLVTRESKISGSNLSNSMRDFSPSEMSDILMKRAKMEILKKLRGWSITDFSETMKGKKIVEHEIMQANAEESTCSVSKESGNVREALPVIIQSEMFLSFLVTNNELSKSVPEPDQLKGSSVCAPTADSVAKTTGITMTMVPEFYDFDKGRSEESFGENQVWALYDAIDGMPRYYSLIQDLISKDPFEVRISWLNFDSNNDLRWQNWASYGYARTIGDFRVGKCEVIKNLISFSHRIKCPEGSNRVIQIFPNKGDVWALYRNWSSDWNEFTPDDVIRQYDVVEVLEDYSDKQGVLVVPLVKVAAFKMVFHQHLDPKTIYAISKEELFRFSHQIPSHILRGDQAVRGLKGCLELDPAALPVEFLQVMRKAEEEKTQRNFHDEGSELLAEVSECEISSEDSDCVIIETVKC